MVNTLVIYVILFVITLFWVPLRLDRKTVITPMKQICTSLGWSHGFYLMQMFAVLKTTFKSYALAAIAKIDLGRKSTYGSFTK